MSNRSNGRREAMCGVSTAADRRDAVGCQIVTTNYLSRRHWRSTAVLARTDVGPWSLRSHAQPHGHPVVRCQGRDRRRSEQLGQPAAAVLGGRRPGRPGSQRSAADDPDGGRRLALDVPRPPSADWLRGNRAALPPAACQGLVGRDGRVVRAVGRSLSLPVGRRENLAGQRRKRYTGRRRRRTSLGRLQQCGHVAELRR